MMLAFNGVGVEEILLILSALIIIILLGNYGKNTVFGYWGSVLLGIFATPLIAFIILAYIRKKSAKPSN